MAKNSHQQNESNNLFFAVSKRKGFNKHDRDGMYKINDFCMSPDDIPPGSDPKYSKGWYDSQPPKDSKYSVMNFLSLPSEAILVNNGNPKVYIIVRHVQGQKYNSYHIVQYSGGAEIEKEYQSILEALTPDNIKWKRNNKGLSDTFKWTITNDNNKNIMTISSDAHNQYLKMNTNKDISLVPHSKADNYCYWTIH